MEAIVRALRDQHAELDRILAGLQPADWERPAPDCPGWSVTDVVLHLAQTDELVIGSGQDRFREVADELTGPVEGEGVGNVDDFAGQMVVRGRGASGFDVQRRWRAGAGAMTAMLAASDPRRPMPWVVNPLPARTMATTRLSETWIHTADVAGAVGLTLEPTERLWHIARLAWRTIPYAFSRAGATPPAGPVAVHLTAPDGDTWDFDPGQAAVTTISGPALDFCLVAARRLEPSKSALVAEGPDAADVLALVRTYA